MEDIVFRIEVFGFDANGKQIFEDMIEEVDSDEAYQSMKTVIAMSSSIDNIRKKIWIPDPVKTLSLELNQYNDGECADKVFKKKFKL